MSVSWAQERRDCAASNRWIADQIEAGRRTGDAREVTWRRLHSEIVEAGADLSEATGRLRDLEAEAERRGCEPGDLAGYADVAIEWEAASKALRLAKARREPGDTFSE